MNINQEIQVRIDRFDVSLFTTYGGNNTGSKQWHKEGDLDDEDIRVMLI